VRPRLEQAAGPQLLLLFVGFEHSLSSSVGSAAVSDGGSSDQAGHAGALRVPEASAAAAAPVAARPSCSRRGHGLHQQQCIPLLPAPRRPP
jgi:hypothetical protein